MSNFADNFKTPISNGYDKIHSVYSYRITVEDGNGCDIFGPFKDVRRKRSKGRISVVEVNGKYILLSNSHDNDELGVLVLDVDNFKDAKEIVDADEFYSHHDFTTIPYKLSYEAFVACLKEVIEGTASSDATS